MNSVGALEKKINYTFKNKTLIRHALTHPSFGRSKFETLEFIGDRVIAMIAAELLWHQIQPQSEKIYAQKFVSITTKSALLEMGQKMNLEELVEWRGCKSHKETIIADACEAVFAAIYLDSNLETANRIFKQFWNPSALSLSETTDPKTSLNIWAQEAEQTVEYTLLTQDGLPHKMSYVVQLTVGQMQIVGSGNSIKNAEKNAAKRFLEQIKEK